MNLLPIENEVSKVINQFYQLSHLSKSDFKDKKELYNDICNLTGDISQPLITEFNSLINNELKKFAANARRKIYEFRCDSKLQNLTPYVCMRFDINNTRQFILKCDNYIRTLFNPGEELNFIYMHNKIMNEIKNKYNQACNSSVEKTEDYINLFIDEVLYHQKQINETHIIWSNNFNKDLEKFYNSNIQSLNNICVEVVECLRVHIINMLTYYSCYELIFKGLEEDLK